MTLKIPRLPRVVAKFFLGVLCLVLSFTSPALAGPRSDDADSRNTSAGDRVKDWVSKPTDRPGNGAPSLSDVLEFAIEKDPTGLLRPDSTGESADLVGNGDRNAAGEKVESNKKSGKSDA
jgi:hypothetical protein